MLSFWQSLAMASISGLLSGALITYFFNKKLDRHQRIMEVRKQIYTNIQEELAGFFDTTPKNIREKSGEKLLHSFRQIQLWASEDVVKQFNKFLYAFNFQIKLYNKITTK